MAAAIWTQHEQNPTEEGIKAAAEVLAIPELLGHILLHVRNSDELAPDKKVSQLWEIEAKRVEPHIPKKQPVGNLCCTFDGSFYVFLDFALRPVESDLFDTKEHQLEIKKQIEQKHKRHRHPPPPRQSRQQRNPRVKYPYPCSRPRNGRR